ncbi:MAG TPA: hypothetical protein VF263_01970 [Longimicrobiaceae bacterium]
MSTPSREIPPPPDGAPLVLVAGGETDPNLHLLLRRLSERGIRSFAIQVGPGSHPAVTWDLQRDTLVVDGLEIRPTGAFIRYDVFAWKQDKKAETAKRADAWFAAVMGWLKAHGVRRPNARMLDANKLHALYVARQVGLEVPETLLTNDVRMLRSLAAERALVFKPVQGGEYCREIDEMFVREREAGPMLPPAIVQPRLEQPEVRIYKIGGRFLAFSMVSDLLDYRAEPTCDVVPLPLEQVPPELLDGLGKLMDRFDMDFGAADFKTDPATGRLLFLEINNSPMFAMFDRVGGGAVSDAMIDLLIGWDSGRRTEAVRIRAASGGCVECGKTAGIGA